MTEALTTHITAEQVTVPSDEALSLGRVAVLEPTTNMRSLERDGIELETNLPAGLDPFEPAINSRENPWDAMTNRHDKTPLNPASLDAVPEGSFVIRGDIEETGADFTSVTYKAERHLDMTTNDYGKVLGIRAFSSPRDWKLEPGTQNLMKSLGYDVQDDVISGVPVPETVKFAAANQGVTLEFFPDQGHIDDKSYLEANEKGAHPVSTMTEGDYKHDIEDDHLTARVLGGDLLTVALQRAAHQGLQAGNNMSAVVSNIDQYTAVLRAAVAPHSQIIGEAYGKERGRDTLIQIGLKLGIDAEATNRIIENCQRRGREFGLTTKELD